MTRSSDSCPGPDALAGWLEGDLSPEQRSRLAAHLAACDDCRRSVVLAATLGPAPESALDERLLDRVVAASRRRPAWRWAAAAAVLVVAVAVAWVAWPRARTEKARGAPPATPVAEGPIPEKAPSTVEAKVPAPAPVPAPPPPTPEPPPAPPVRKEEEPRTEVVKEPEPAPGMKEEAPSIPEDPAPLVKSEGPGKTVSDPSVVFASVFAVDPQGDLWIRRGRGDPGRAGAFEDMAMTDSFCARDAGAGFTLEGRATVVLERGAEAVFCYFKPEKAYSVDLVQGGLMIDTEGTPQNWRASRGGAILSFSSLNGRLSLETRGEQLAALLLEGRSDLKSGMKTEKVEAGREVVVSADGKTSVRRAETKKKIQRFGELRPRVTTAFAATFDEVEGAPRPFAYEVAAGRPAEEGGGRHLRAVPSEERDRTLYAAEIRAGRPVPYTSGLLLRFRYRTTAPALTLRLGGFAAPFASAVSGGRWVEGEVPVAAFEREGVPIVPLEEVSGIRFEASFERKTPGRLDVDAIQLLRRAR